MSSWTRGGLLVGRTSATQCYRNFYFCSADRLDALGSLQRRGHQAWRTVRSQWAIADAAARGAGWVRPTVSEYVDRQYAGAKAALRPIYDALAAVINEFGDDVTVEGRASYTPFVGGRQFAAIAAATRDRVDLGLRFTDPPRTARLQPGGGPGQATHRVSFRNMGEVDAEIVRLLRVAYEQNA